MWEKRGGERGRGTWYVAWEKRKGMESISDKTRGTNAIEKELERERERENKRRNKMKEGKVCPENGKRHARRNCRERNENGFCLRDEDREGGEKKRETERDETKRGGCSWLDQPETGRH